MPSRVAHFKPSTILLFCIGVLAWSAVACSTPPVPSAIVSDPTIDTLLGGSGRAEVGARIDATGHTWQEYADWGKELFANGFVKKPPLGPSPSPKISDAFTCNRCHNIRREDPVLTYQNPDARLAYIQARGEDLVLAPGTTLWGAVNRVTFYNDLYSKYRGLCVPETTTDTQVSIGGPDAQGKCAKGTRVMNPASFEDAVQICSGYCSVGRYLIRWELDAILAYFWDQELHLSDLDLTPDQEQDVRSALSPVSSDVNRVAAARKLLMSNYLTAAGDTYRGVPAVADDHGTVVVGAYSDGALMVGDVERGRATYTRACVQCHGTPIEPLTGSALIADVAQFYRILADGRTPPNQPYMPEFTLQRLSRQQSADIHAYLKQ